ncbi:MAG TPA: hypothetical protein VFO10_02460 [Oligoflexus sp.]|uniref:hypothetical protein n=1 Tax=Oligoflexus sp. TaxID=1971216 RepID=UPI002D7E3D44|nr:hypothetical protein [Oligoflexus sp.]HET9236083.1 hypothetical protein [Oligoflexus sp.]
MKILPYAALVLTFLSTALEARDQIPREKKAALTPLEYNAVDQTIMSGTGQYAPSIRGLREYMDREVASGSGDYERLSQRLEELERQDAFAFRASMVPFGLGLGSLLVGSLLREDEEPTDPRLKSVHETGGRLMLYGLGGIAAGFLVNVALAPGESDVRDFIQLHNGQASTTRHGGGSHLSLRILSENTLVSLSYSF